MDQVGRAQMRLRLALVVPALGEGGGVTSVARFVKNAALSDERIDLQLISLATSAFASEGLGLTRPKSWIRGPVAVPGVWEGLPFVSVGAVASEFEFQRYRPRAVLKSLLSSSDVIQVVCGSPAWACAVVRLGKPVAIQVATLAKVERRQRDGRAKGGLGYWRKAMTRITNRLDQEALLSAQAIQVENPWMLDYTRRLNGERDVDIRYAPPGVDTAQFCPDLPTRGVVGKDRYILCVGRLSDPRKKISLLLEAYQFLPEGLRNQARLVLAGSSAPPAEFWQRVSQLGLEDRVSFIHRPSQEELIRLYQQADVFALSSDEEGLGVVLLEAMACGVPVISTRSGGPDGIISDGHDGFLVPLDDAGAMAEKLSLILGDRALASRMGSAARLTIERSYSEGIAGSTFRDMWWRLAGRD